MYKFVINNDMKMTNIEFERYLKKIMKEISLHHIIEKKLNKTNDLNRVTGAIIKYK